MRIAVVGPGRAGGSLTLAADRAGHDVVGVLSRRSVGTWPVLPWDEPLPPIDLLLITVRDDALAEVAARLAPISRQVKAAAHVSGYTSVAVLSPLADQGVATGSLHPLQTLPNAEIGSAALAGAWAAVTAEGGLHDTLVDFATSLGMVAFRLDDSVKAVYHAAAASGSNYVVEALALAEDLLGAAGVPFEAIEPLTRRVVDNIFAIGPAAALTGPIARGDTATVAGQQAAVDRVSPDLGEEFSLLVRATAARVGRR